MRRPVGPFGWLDTALLREGWLERLGAPGTAVLALLALAADPRGASFYGRDRMARALALSRASLDLALERLIASGLVAHRPWRAGCDDGVWQILPLAPPLPKQSRSEGALPVGDLLAELRQRAAP